MHYLGASRINLVRGTDDTHIHFWRGGSAP